MKLTITTILAAVACATNLCFPLAAAEQKPAPASAPAASAPAESKAAKVELRSFKGWELYSWKPKDADWNFSLLTGTNRNKSMDEVLDAKEKIVGVAALKDRLGHLATGEFVSWSGQKRMKPADKLSYPPREVIDDIEKFAKTRKLEFTRPQ